MDKTAAHTAAFFIALHFEEVKGGEAPNVCREQIPKTGVGFLLSSASFQKLENTELKRFKIKCLTLHSGWI